MSSQAALCSSALSESGLAEHMWMAADELVADRADHRLEIERALLARHLSVEHDLKHQVAELTLEMREIASIDGIGHLVRFLDRVGGDAREGLNAIPGAAVLRPQAPHDREELSQARDHDALPWGAPPASAACRAVSNRLNVISMPAVAPQMMRSPYGMS